MRILTDGSSDGIRTRTFEVDARVGEGTVDVVPGICWSPPGADGPRPKVLFGHGGGQHKEAPNIVAMAHRLVRDHGYACVAVDHVGHGDRVTEEQRAAQRDAARERETARRRAIGEGRPIERPALPGDGYPEIFLRSATGWSAALDAVEALDDVGSGPTGWWGVSMGTGVGLPFVSGEPRFTCAVLGLASASPKRPKSLGMAAAITVPILFLSQADDGGHPVADALRLWDGFGSTEKTFHLNPGPHVGIPAFERRASIEFFVRHLGSVDAAVAGPVRSN